MDTLYQLQDALREQFRTELPGSVQVEPLGGPRATGWVKLEERGLVFRRHNELIVLRLKPQCCELVYGVVLDRFTYRPQERVERFDYADPSCLPRVRAAVRHHFSA